MGRNLSLKCVMFQYVRCRKSKECVSSIVIHHRENLIQRHGCSASSVLSRFSPFLFWKLKLALKGGDGMTSAEFKNSLLLYAVQTVEKMVHIIRDRALKNVPCTEVSMAACLIN